MLKLPIPNTLEEITVDFLKHALKGHEWSSSISEIKVPQETTFQGAMSSVIAIDLLYDTKKIEHAPSRIVMKLLPFSAGFKEARSMGGILAAYRKEVQFYRYLQSEKEAANLLTIFPQVYFAYMDSSEQFVVLIEYLEGARLQIKGISDGEAGDALHSVSKLHAKFWHNWSKQEEVEKNLHAGGYTATFQLANFWLIALLGAKQDNFDTEDIVVQDAVCNLIDSMWSNFCRVIERFDFAKHPEFADYVLPDSVKALTAYKENGKLQAFTRKALVKICKKNEMTLLHSDFRTENMIFTPTGVKLIDLQCLNFGNVGFDLAQFLSNNLTVKQRRATERQLLKGYLDQLHKGNPLTLSYTFEHLWEDYHYGTVFHAVLMASGVSKWGPLQDNGTLETVLGRHLYLCMYMLEGDMAALLDALEAQPQ